jgi:predicted permease
MYPSRVLDTGASPSRTRTDLVAGTPIVGYNASMAVEVRHAFRRLRRSPGFFAAAVLTVAFGAAPTLLFTAASWAMLPPLPLAEPETLVVLTRTNAWGDRFPTSYPKYELLREQSRTLDVMAFATSSMTLGGQEGLGSVKVEPITPNAFGLLRVTPFLGRTFREDENQVPLGHPVAVLGEAFWRRQLSGDPAVLGRTLTLNGVAFTVVGVVPATFGGLNPALHSRHHRRSVDVWVPAVMAPLGFDPRVRNGRWIRGGSPHAQWLSCAARIRPGFDYDDVAAELATLSARMHALWPARNGDGVPDDRFLAWPAAEYAVDPHLVAGLRRLRLAGALVALLACLNVSQLLVARDHDRQGDLAVRLALGASPSRFAIEPIVHSAAIAFTGLAAAAGLVWLIVRAVGSYPSAASAAVFGTSLDAPIPLTALVPTSAALLAVVVAVGALMPAWVRTRTSLATVIQAHHGAARAAGFRSLAFWKPRGLCAVLQVAIAIALVVPCGLLVRSLANVLARDLGFEPHGVVAARFSLPSPHDTPDASRAFLDAIDARLRSVNTVSAWGYADCLPLSESCLGTGLTPASGGRELAATVHTISPGLVDALGLRLVSGRAFGPGDREGTPDVALVSAEAARQLGDDPVGLRIRVGAFVESAEVVGVVGDTHYQDLAAPIAPAVYIAYAQHPRPQGFIAVRGHDAWLTPTTFAEAVAAIPSGPRTVSVLNMPDLVAASVARVRMATMLVTCSASMALGLAGVGVFGLLAWLIGRARHEIAVRLALGAAPRDIAGLILRTTGFVCAAGLAGGLVVGLWSAMHMRDLLFGVAPWDVTTLATSAIAAVLLGAGAALTPALRAARTDPAGALHVD